VTPPAMITGHVPAVRLPAGDAAGCVAVAVPARGILEERGDTAVTSPARSSAAAARGAAEAFLGGPGADRGAARRDPARPPGPPADDRDPGTVLRWHRDIVRRRWAAKSRRKQPGAPGDPPQRLQPGASSGLRESGVGLPRLCRAPHSRRIHGELAGLGVKVAASNVWEILKASGVDPPLRRTGPTWQQFLRSQAGGNPGM
jgi:hypothetical protein